MCRIEENIRLCYKFATEYHKKFHSRVSYDDVFQVACLGLVIADKSFDDSKGVKFSTHASNNIIFSILNSIRNDKWYMGKRKENLDNPPPMSLDIEYGTGNGSTRSGYDFVGVCMPHEIIDARIDIENSMKELSDLEKKVIYMYFYKDMKAKNIAKKLNKSISIVTYAKKTAIKK